MAEGKWIEGLTAETPLLEAARHVFFVRLQVVRDHLPHAVFESDRDPEHVHQLRVATRRADAAVRLFEPCLPRPAFRAARRRLRNLRRAAGVARDCDVFLIELAARATTLPKKDLTGLDFLRAYALGARGVAQGSLEQIGQKQLPTFEAFLSDTIEAVRPPHDAGRNLLIEQARPVLLVLRQELEQMASADLSDYAHLHQVRITGKRLRYGMEVFASCFASEFRDDIYPKIEEMQEILGRANDSHVATARLSGLRNRLKRDFPEDWKRIKVGIESLLRYHQRRLPLERKRFMVWWEKWRQSGSEKLMNLVVTNYDD